MCIQKLMQIFELKCFSFTQKNARKISQPFLRLLLLIKPNFLILIVICEIPRQHATDHQMCQCDLPFQSW